MFVLRSHFVELVEIKGTSQKTGNDYHIKKVKFSYNYNTLELQVSKELDYDKLRVFKLGDLVDVEVKIYAKGTDTVLDIVSITPATK